MLFRLILAVLDRKAILVMSFYQLQHRAVLVICKANVNTCMPLKISNVNIDVTLY